jgi:hypothetical protein
VGSSRELGGSSGSLEPPAPLGMPRVSDRGSGERVVGLPRAPPWPLAVAGPGLRGIPLFSASRGRSHGKATFMAFASPSERSWKRWNRLALVPPLMGLGSLPPVYLTRVHSGEPVRKQACELAPVGPAPPGAGSRSALVVSHHLDGLLRA